MISELIVNFKELGLPGVLVIIVAWVIWTQVRQQTKQNNTTNEFILDMFKNELKVLHEDSLKNAELNNKSIVLLKEHAKESRGHSAKIAGILKNLLITSNGGNPTIKKLIEKVEKLEKGEPT